AARARKMADWKRRLYSDWHNIRIESVETQVPDTVHVGDDMRVRARVHLGTINPDDISVQIYHGRLDAYGNIVEGEIVPMVLSESKDNAGLFSGAIRYFKSGRHGFTVRVLPHHDDLGTPFETGLIQWASQGQLSEAPRAVVQPV
ncbi:MAG TPA: hypothetical protein V6D22_08295, partial [Candidatus Obscuribacterales bacterium]